MRFAILVTLDNPGPRSRVWGSAFENEHFSSGVSQRTAIQLEEGYAWGMGIVSANAPTPFRAWAKPLQAFTRVGRLQVKALVGAGLLNVFLREVADDEWEEFDRPVHWKTRANWVAPAPVGFPRARRAAVTRSKPSAAGKSRTASKARKKAGRR